MGLHGGTGGLACAVGCGHVLGSAQYATSWLRGLPLNCWQAAQYRPRALVARYVLAGWPSTLTMGPLVAGAVLALARVLGAALVALAVAALLALAAVVVVVVVRFVLVAMFTYLSYLLCVSARCKYS